MVVEAPERPTEINSRIGSLVEFIPFRGKPEQSPIIKALPKDKREPAQKRKGIHLFEQGVEATTLHLVISGQFALVTSTDSGKELTTDIVKPGDIVGWESIEANNTYSSTAVAEEESQVISISIDMFQNLIETDPSLVPLFFSLLAKAKERQERQAHLYKMGDSSKRIASALHDYVDDNSAIKNRQVNIAMRAGVDRTTVNDTLSDLEDAGIITRFGVGNRKVIVVFDESELQASGVVFPSLPERKIDTKLQFVSAEARRAGQLLEKAQIDQGIRDETLAYAIDRPLNIDAMELDAFRVGDFTILALDLSNIYQGATKIIDTSDPYILELEQLAQEQEWLRTLSQEGMTINKALLYLRLNQGLDSQIYAIRNHKNKNTVNEHERGYRHNPDLYNLNLHIDTLGLNANSKPAQLLRLKREDMETMDLQNLAKCNIGALIRYLRILKGATQKDLESTLKRKEKTISDYELGTRKIPKIVTDHFIDWLGLGPNSSLGEIIRQKAQFPEQIIPIELLQETLTEHYLFSEHIEQLAGQFMVSDLDPHDLSKKFEEASNIADMVLLMGTLIDGKENVDKAWSRRIHKSLFTDVKQGHIPKDITLFQLALGLGYTIHHRIMRRLLDQAEKERAERRSHRSKTDEAKVPV